MKDIDRKEWSLLRRATSLRHALRGVARYLRVTPNAWVHIVTIILLAILGCYFKITKIEWTILVIANGVVLAGEAFNSAIEIDMDLTQPDEHPMVRDTKDIAAGAVLILGVTAWVVDILIFFPYLKTLF